MYLYYTQNYTDTSQHYPIWQVCDILYPLNGNVEESMIKKNIIINNIKLWGTLLSNKAVGHFYCSTTKLFEKHGTMQFVALSLNSSILGGPIPWFIFDQVSSSPNTSQFHDHFRIIPKVFSSKQFPNDFGTADIVFICHSWVLHVRVTFHPNPSPEHHQSLSSHYPIIPLSHYPIIPLSHYSIIPII